MNRFLAAQRQSYVDHPFRASEIERGLTQGLAPTEPWHASQSMIGPREPMGERLTLPAFQKQLDKSLSRGKLTTYEGELLQTVLDRARKVSVEAQKSKCVKYGDLAALNREFPREALTHANILFARSMVYALLTTTAEYVDYAVSKAKSMPDARRLSASFDMDWPELKEMAQTASVVFGLAEEALVLIDDVEAGALSPAKAASQLRSALRESVSSLNNSEIRELAQTFLPIADRIMDVKMYPEALELRKKLGKYTDMAGLRFRFATLQLFFSDLAQGKVHSNDSYISPQVAGELKYMMGLGCKPEPAAASKGIPQWAWIAGGAALAFLLVRK